MSEATVSQGAPKVSLPRSLRRPLSHLAPAAFGAACGAVLAANLFAATTILLVRGGEVVGPHLSLLGHYLPGYGVSWTGALVGVFYALVIGFLGGFMFAVLRNIVVALYLRFIWTRFQHHAASDLLDRMS